MIRHPANMQQNIATALAVTITVMAALYIASPTGAAENTAGGAAMTPVERVKATEKGQLKNPLSLTPEIVAEGKALYQAKTCGACHGGNGSGNHCPSLINDAWVYGSDDDTLFRLVTLGSEKLLSDGYARGDKEQIAGPMPALGEAITDEQELWKIITFIRSLKPGAPVN
jgi:mono/diheme cytochrome c family protein